MFKRILAFAVLALLMLSCAAASAQNPVRVKCGRFIVNVPSANAKCFQVEENIQLSEGASPEEIARSQTASYAIYIADYASLNPAIDPQITFYTIDDLAKTSFDLLDITMEMSEIIINLSSGYSDLNEVYFQTPFLPYQSSVRRVTALPKQLDFENGSGIRTIAVFDDTVKATYGSSNLYYSYQGISSDGTYYISAVFPLINWELDQRPTADIDWQGIGSLNFQPSLEELDYYIQSIVIE